MLKISRRRVLPVLAGLSGLPHALHSGSAMAQEQMAQEQKPEQKAMTDPPETRFPADFTWGASTSSYQIEGAVDEDGRGKSIWDVYSHTPGMVKNGDTGDVACDHYHRWVEDVEWLARGGFNAYRFSTAWPRILPAGGGAIEPRGLDFYDRLVDGLITRGVTPWLCLYHWDLPQALQEQGGGWLNRDTADKFADYARIVARRLGDRVKHWVMFNEANIHALFGYGMGGHAPGLKGLVNMIRASHHQNLAQGKALSALRAERADLRLGTVLNISPVRPSSDSEADRRAVERFDGILERRFPRSAVQGCVSGGGRRRIRAGRRRGRSENHPPADRFLRAQLLRAGLGEGSAGEPVRRLVRRGAGGHALYRDRLAGRCQRVERRARPLARHYGNPEVYVTENGACYDDHMAADGRVADDERVTYLREHIAAARRAIADGVKLKGYFAWSLLDNFEWSEGYSRRFGLIYVDFASQKRTPKASFNFLAETVKRRG